MFKASFKLGIFRSEDERKRSEAALKSLLWALVKINCNYLRAFPDTLPLYQTGVIYKREGGLEEWKDIPSCLADGHGDCEDLATWRCAELIMHSRVHARPFISRQRIRYPGVDIIARTMYHIRVIYPNGRIEDPSKKLGM